MSKSGKKFTLLAQIINYSSMVVLTVALGFLSYNLYMSTTSDEDLSDKNDSKWLKSKSMNILGIVLLLGALYLQWSIIQYCRKDGCPELGMYFSIDFIYGLLFD